jgi:hypothetical protein
MNRKCRYQVNKVGVATRLPAGWCEFCILVVIRNCISLFGLSYKFHLNIFYFISVGSF